MTDKQIIIDKLENDVACKENIINHLSEHNIKLQNQFKRKEQELKKICKAFDIEYAIDEETGSLFGRCNKLYKKEQECEELKKEKAEIKKYLGISHKTILERLEELTNFRDRDREELDQLKAENDKMSKGYAELTEIVSPYIDDFTGYNEKLGGFDIVLCVKELLQQIKHLQTENDRLMILKDKTYFKLKEEYLQHLDQLKTERDKIKAIGDNYFDEYEMCCLDLPDAIDSLLKRYDNAFTRFKKERKELKDIKG